MARTQDAAADDRIVAPAGAAGEDDPALRPQRLADFVGQPRATRLLSVSLNGARRRGEAMDHALLYGPPGLGKTTLANIIANELGAGFRAVSAPAIARPGDLASALVTLQERDVLFIDEIHRLTPLVEEVLYSAMEDFRLDIVAGEPGRAQPVSIPLPRFTLVAATTRSGMLTRPLRDRFGVDVQLELYAAADLARVVARSAALLGVALDPGVAEAVARRARGTPRIANRLLRRLRDFAADADQDHISLPVAADAFALLEIDDDGLDEKDRRYLDCLRHRFRGRPVGLETLAAALNEDAGTLESEVEPWLLQRGLLDRTPRGRVLGQAAPCGGEQGQRQGKLL